MDGYDTNNNKNMYICVKDDIDSKIRRTKGKTKRRVQKKPINEKNENISKENRRKPN
jgi:hypothetical protein